MKILAIDTANSNLCLAVSNQNGDFFYKSEEKNIQAEKICTKIDEILEKSCEKLENITHFVINTGPGSFTGVRIGVSYLAGILAFDRKKIIELDTFDILLHSVKMETNGKNSITVLRADNFSSIFIKKYDKNMLPCSEIEIIDIDEIENNEDCVFYIDEEVFDKASHVKNAIKSYKSSSEGLLRASKFFVNKAKFVKIITPSYCKSFL